MELGALANPGVEWGKAVRLLPENRFRHPSNLQSPKSPWRARTAFALLAFEPVQFPCGGLHSQSHHIDRKRIGLENDE
jgi:hypothetical protein